MPEQSSVDAKRAQGSGWRYARLITAGSLLVSYAVIATFILRECVTKSTETTTRTLLETTCQPPTVSSATVLILLLLFVLLLWPDISEVTVLGVSLKRRIAAAESDAKHAKDEVRSLHTSFQIQQTRIEALAAATAAASSSASVTMNGNWDIEPRWSKRMSERLEEAAKTQAADESTTDSPAHSAENSASTSELKLRLLSEYEGFASQMGYTYDRRHLRTSQDPNTKRWLHAQNEFFDQYRDAVQSVRALRNGIAHAKEVTHREVDEGLRVLERLRTLLANYFTEMDVHPPFEEKQDGDS